jgi:hypothetical protein
LCRQQQCPRGASADVQSCQQVDQNSILPAACCSSSSVHASTAAAAVLA